MPFPQAETARPDLAGLAIELRACLENSAYTRNAHQVYDNLDSDPLITDHATAGRPACRADLLAAVVVHRAVPVSLKGETVNFCRAHQQEGPPMPGSITIFGRVSAFDSMVTSIRNEDSSLTVENATALLRDVIDNVAAADRLGRQRTDLSGKPLSKRQMWCFPITDPAAPFADIGATRAEAVNILGLGYFAYKDPGAALYRWAHTLPASLTAHSPTAWDAADNPDWRPGGQTYRLDSDAAGVSEVVHMQITGEYLAVPIEPIV